MLEIEKKLSEAINLVFLFFKTLFYFAFPLWIVKRMKGEQAVFPPLAFLSILSFFGLKLWAYFFLYVNIGTENAELQLNTDATLAKGKELMLDDFITIPDFDEIVGLTIPYILLVAALVLVIKRATSRIKINQDLDLGSIATYFCGFLVVLVPIVLLISNAVTRNISTLGTFLILFVAVTPYLFLMLAGAISKNLNRMLRLRVIATLSLLLPVLTVTFMLGSLYLSTHVSAFENEDLSPENADIYRHKVLFEASISDPNYLNQKDGWEIALNVCDRASMEYILDLKNPHGKIYGVRCSENVATCKYDLCTLQQITLPVNDAQNDVEKVSQNFRNVVNRVKIGTEPQNIFVKTSQIKDTSHFNAIYLELDALQEKSLVPEKVIIELFNEEEGTVRPANFFFEIGMPRRKNTKKNKSLKDNRNASV